MKRCPQCEFIYEDDQSLCDMDGALLVLDARSLPSLHVLAAVEAPMAASRAHWRHRTFPAMAALILATVFSLVYFVSTQRTASSPAPISVAPVTAPASNLVAPTESNPTPPVTEANGPAAADPEEPKPQATKSPATQPAKKATSKTSTTQRQPTTESKKDDSKVGNILKKTGRILKKPFRF